MDMPYLDDIEFDDLFNSNGAVPGLDSALDDLFSSESSLMCSSFPELELNENYCNFSMVFAK